MTTDTRRQCRTCGTGFEVTVPGRRYCGESCRKHMENLRHDVRKIIRTLDESPAASDHARLLARQLLTAMP